MRRAFRKLRNKTTGFLGKRVRPLISALHRAMPLENLQNPHEWHILITRVGDHRRFEAKATDPMTSVHLPSIKLRNMLTEGFEDTDWIAGPVWSIPLAPIANPTTTFIHPYPVYPPEAVYPRELPTDAPSVVTRETGKSRLVYMAGDMDASYWRLDNADLERQLINAMHWLIRDSNPVQVNGEGLMEVIGWETESGFAIHLLNYNAPNAFRGRMRKPIQLGKQVVSVQLPPNVKAKAASLLRAETSIPFKQTGRVVRMNVPSVGIYEVMTISDEMRQLIMREGNALDIAQQAQKEGIRNLRQSGLLKAKAGITSLEEIEAVTNE